MERINLIIKNNKYIDCLEKNVQCEEQRVFCKHSIQHGLDVARIAYILNLEKKYNFKKDIIYATALLHDIGRWKEYKNICGHEIASANIAKKILKNCNFNKGEIDMIISAIVNHRMEIGSNRFNKLIYLADKKSRNCFCCKGSDLCKWSLEKKNFDIET